MSGTGIDKHGARAAVDRAIELEERRCLVANGDFEEVSVPLD